MIRLDTPNSTLKESLRIVFTWFIWTSEINKVNEIKLRLLENMY